MSKRRKAKERSTTQSITRSEKAKLLYQIKMKNGEKIKNGVAQSMNIIISEWNIHWTLWERKIIWNEWANILPINILSCVATLSQTALSPFSLQCSKSLIISFRWKMMVLADFLSSFVFRQHQIHKYPPNSIRFLPFLFPTFCSYLFDLHFRPANQPYACIINIFHSSVFAICIGIGMDAIYFHSNFCRLQSCLDHHDDDDDDIREFLRFRSFFFFFQFFPFIFGCFSPVAISFPISNIRHHIMFSVNRKKN